MLGLPEQRRSLAAGRGGQARPWGQLMAVSGGWANSAKEPSEPSLREFPTSGVLYSLLVDSASLSAVYINVRFQDRVGDHQGTRRIPEGGQPAQNAAAPLAHKCICPCSPPVGRAISKEPAAPGPSQPGLSTHHS